MANRSRTLPSRVTRPVLNSPLYGDGPWLKDPLVPDLFRHHASDTPDSNTVNQVVRQSNKGGGNRKTPEPFTSVTSVHKKGNR